MKKLMCTMALSLAMATSLAAEAFEAGNASVELGPVAASGASRTGTFEMRRLDGSHYSNGTYFVEVSYTADCTTQELRSLKVKEARDAKGRRTVLREKSTGRFAPDVARPILLRLCQ